LFIAFSLGAAPVCAEDGGDRTVILWVWERPEDLRHIDPHRVEVAFLAATIKMQEGGLKVLTRRHPVRLHKETRLTAVIRIESDRKSKLAPFRGEVEDIIVDITGALKAERLQIDFDARETDRISYRELLSALRNDLPGVGISITALASWCMSDRWLGGLPVDEVTPMLFRMGPEGAEILRRIETNGGFIDNMCGSSVGISTDEPVGRLPDVNRVYVFSPSGWGGKRAADIFQEVEVWRR
jgi:hypothetical protein